jgi:hypothetical protein
MQARQGGQVVFSWQQCQQRQCAGAQQVEQRSSARRGGGNGQMADMSQDQFADNANG